MHIQHHEGNPSISIPAGIVIGLLASCVQSLGLTIQRKSHVLNQALPESEQRVEHRRPLWLLGFAIFISSNILGSLFQIASLPVVILAPLGAVSLLWNAFFARFLLGDLFSPWMILGTLLIAGGAVVIAVFGIVPEPTHSLEDLLRLFSRPTFVVYFSALAFVVVLCLVITHVVEYSYYRGRRLALPQTPPLSPTLLPTDAVTTQLATTERTPLIDRKRASSSRSIASNSSEPLSPTGSPADSEHTTTVIAISYASISGILSGMCLLFAKSGVELLLLTLGGQNQFWRWQAWMLVLGLAAFALLQLWYLHKSLVLADPTLVCPLAFCFYNLSSIVNGLVYYDQFSLLPTWHLWLVGLGIVVLLAGVWVVSFYAGGGRVDVGTWQEENAVPEIDEISEDQHVFIGQGEVQEPDAEVPLSPTISIQMHSEHERSRTSLVLSPQRHSATSRKRYSTIGSPEGHYPPQLPSFSIGLSPVSPGFAVVPRGRRRIISGVGLGGGSERSVSIRRSVSDSGLDPGAREVEHHSEDERRDVEGAGADGHGRTGRWRWMRNVFRVGRK